jgi:hypothetical protein
MKKYLNKIELSKNSRGCWDLDPFKGCVNTKLNNGNGCYGICYAVKIAKSKGYNFSDVIKRYFISDKHFFEIVQKLKKIPFVRLGVMCDPSFDWEHTLNIVDKIKPYQKNIIIVTKHIKRLNDEQIKRCNGLIINTSICALDNIKDRKKRLYEYNRLKKYCKSVLRVNTANYKEHYLEKIQAELLNNDDVIDTVLRFPKNHILVKKGIINIKRYKFLDSFVYASKHKDDIFFGYCYNCKDLCGATSSLQSKLLDYLKPMHQHNLEPNTTKRNKLLGSNTKRRGGER